MTIDTGKLPTEWREGPSSALDTSGAEAKIVNAVRTIITKAMVLPTEDTRPTGCLVFNFDGAGAPLVIGMGAIPEIPPGAWRITGAHMLSGIWNANLLRIVPITCTCQVELRLSSQGQWQGGSVPLYGLGIRPSMFAAAETDLDVSLWTVDLQPGDIISAALVQLTGTPSVLTLILTLARLDVPGIHAPAITDTTGAFFTNAAGEPFTLRT